MSSLSACRPLRRCCRRDRAGTPRSRSGCSRRAGRGAPLSRPPASSPSAWKRSTAARSAARNARCTPAPPRPCAQVEPQRRRARRAEARARRRRASTSTWPSAASARLVEAHARVEILHLQSDVVVHDDLLCQEIILGSGGEPILEDLAVALRRLAEARAARRRRRDGRCARSSRGRRSRRRGDVGDRARRRRPAAAPRGAGASAPGTGAASRRATCAKSAQEVERAEPGLRAPRSRGRSARARARRSRAPPRPRGGDRARRRRAARARAARRLRRSAPRSSMPDLVEADVAARPRPPPAPARRAPSARAAAARRRCARSRAPVADRLDQLGRELEGQALVAADVVVVRADVLVAGMADEDRARPRARTIRRALR